MPSKEELQTLLKNTEQERMQLYESRLKESVTHLIHVVQSQARKGKTDLKYPFQDLTTSYYLIRTDLMDKLKQEFPGCLVSLSDSNVIQIDWS